MTYDPKSSSHMLPPLLRFVCRVLGVLCFISWIVAALGLVALAAALVLGGIGVLPQLRGVGVLLTLALFAIPLAGLAFGLQSAERLFTALRRGDYFLPGTAKALKNFSIGMLVYFLTPPLIMLFLVATRLVDNATFPKFETLGFTLRFPPGMDGIDGVLLAVFLGAIVLFASIWERAVTLAQESRRLADENAQFV